MVDIETRKKLFEDYADCKLMRISRDGTVMRCSSITVEYAAVDKDGNVRVHWHSGPYSQLKYTKVNAVNQVSSNEYEGIFTDEKEAIDIVKTWIDAVKLEKIKKLEEELAELKKDL